MNPRRSRGVNATLTGDDNLLERLLGLGGVAASRRLAANELLLSPSAAGEPTSADDALYVVAAGRVHVSRDPQQSTGGRGRRRAPRAAFAFRLAELGPGSLIGVHEFASRRRSEGVYLATEPTLLWRLNFDAIDALAARDPLSYAAVCRLVSAELCAECDRTKWRLGSILDALHSKPLRDPLPRAALRALGEVAGL